ncbi:MAG TPA: glycosyltransferase family 39 protein [Pyrinomonadaceae bacterium]|nr:glycosyltransferase family 39 protein [Pyrinomonadaceae bacterium]
MASDIKVSSSLPAVEIDPRTGPWPAVELDRRGGLLASLDWTVVGTLAICVVLGLGLRISNLGAIGFAEDEMNKLDALRAYERGDISANAEHPMMMKALMFASVKAASAWHNLTARAVSDEFALRLPNAIVGALTAIPLFLLTAAYFDRWTGLLAAGFWAFGINAISLNRVGKEDTLLVFFMLFAFYFYVRAKQISSRDDAAKRRNYILSAISFGFMLASKYFPHYFGLNALFHHKFHVRKPESGEPSGKTPTIFYVLILVAFLLANPAVLLPQVWDYLNAYTGERLLVHTGYLFGDQLYKNNMSSTPFWGTPVFFYLLFMAIKIPLLVLASFVVGFFVSLKRWRHPGHAFVVFMFLFWIVPYSLIGGKWLRYTLSLMPFVYMIAAVGVIAVIGFLSKFLKVSRQASAIVSAAAVTVFVLLPGWTAYAHGPHYALYTNALGAGRTGYYFPHDEFYDDGLREAIKFVSDVAPQHAIITHETPAVTRYYRERFSRPDLNSQVISSTDFDPAKLAAPAYIIVQRGRTYFENRKKIDFIRDNFKKVYEVKIKEATAAEVFVNQKI